MEPAKCYSHLHCSSALLDKMLQPLSIRNLTSAPIELRLVERFDLPHESARYLASFLTFSGSANPTAKQLGSSSDSYHTEEVSISIEPLKTLKTSILPAASQSKATVRLTFENEGQKYRINIPTPLDRSVTLMPLSTNPRHEYTAVYLPEHSFLTLYSSANLDCWMKFLKDETPLTSLSIPGTHNSPTHHRALPSVRCQAVTVKEQLDNGIRFFDIRVQPENAKDVSKPSLYLVHSMFPICLTRPKYFRDFLSDIERFLSENPSETVILSLKREGTGSATDEHLSLLIKRHYVEKDQDKWFTEPRVPSLHEARKKIVLMRRFRLDNSLKGEWNGRGWAIDASSWADNTPCALNPTGEICIQDFYEVLESQNIEKKIIYVQEQLARAAEQAYLAPGNNLAPSQSRNSLYINFLSASNFWKSDCWPEKIAAKINPAIINYLCRKHNEPEEGKKIGDGCTGIVVCDWVGNNGDWDLVRCIVGMNAKLQARQRDS